MEPAIGLAHRVRPLAGPMAGSGETRWALLNVEIGNSRFRLALEKGIRVSYNPIAVAPPLAVSKAAPLGIILDILSETAYYLRA
jgi:hypothetical protein